MLTADDAIDLRRLWERFNYRSLLPSATVLADRDWLAYVAAMTEAVPCEAHITFPEEAEIAWAWPDGVAVIFSEPVEVSHTIISRTDLADGGSTVTPVPAHAETQTSRGLLIGPPTMMETKSPDGDPLPEALVRPVLWIGEDPTDIISGRWLAGMVMLASETGVISQSSRLLLSIITALGHRLTRVGPVVGASRQERRRVERELPGLRVLSLATGASVSRAETAGTVAWTHRWMVRGHWRLQPHGPKRSLRRTIWIDPYVKGPEDKPLDVRPTVWTTDGAPSEGGTR
jgi:hypothetical protein